MTDETLLDDELKALRDRVAARSPDFSETMRR